jgi:ribulose-5-phosphate 4-epimerase/fuculose-1-phosphate aldolase
MIEESIKFNCNQTKIPLKQNIKEINQVRQYLYSLSLIGAYPNGIGYGNLSVRLKNEKGFIITGTGTGGIENLSKQHYTKVLDWKFEENYVYCEGLIKASSESMTHAAVYEVNKENNAVIHIHNRTLWEKLINQVPTTSNKVKYGTPEMAQEVFRLFQNTDVENKKIFVMAGHEEGIISFGKNLKEAQDILMSYIV